MIRGSNFLIRRYRASSTKRPRIGNCVIADDGNTLFFLIRMTRLRPMRSLTGPRVIFAANGFRPTGWSLSAVRLLRLKYRDQAREVWADRRRSLDVFLGAQLRRENCS